MTTPLRYKVNGYYVMEVNEGWEVSNSDRRLKGPFATEEEAIQAAEKLPSKG
ncbi:DUF2188 domain-containing protein [Pseudomonas viridiflava]|uniref:DUF2188 domain-containing protein n=1 Tax=Pseudomonas viridiflava TaxID=33069 RepID=UPI000F01140C|nr:DUF2188 domain-containing protein [Pseudomonas viridiflava]MEE4228268.1 DUF2188 domain-containing protein [Pseudomonas viridiflava]QVI86649.1 DUF2188 domain-containing protein [Pseudomonas viridiflava]